MSFAGALIIIAVLGDGGFKAACSLFRTVYVQHFFGFGKRRRKKSVNCSRNNTRSRKRRKYDGGYTLDLRYMGGGGSYIRVVFYTDVFEMLSRI